MSKNLLHKNKLNEFIAYLDKNGIKHRPGKGPYQVIQVDAPGQGWQVVFSKIDMPEHYSINVCLELTVRDFIKNSKQERSLSDIGNELHNLSCEVVHFNEDWAIQMSKLAEELWKRK